MSDGNNKNHGTLVDRLRSHRDAQQQQADAWAKFRDEWLEDLPKLYGNLRVWLSEMEKEGLVVVQLGQSAISEPHVGRYMAPHLRLSFSNERKVIEVTTGGMETFGAAGLVAVSAGPKREIIINRTRERRWVYIQKSKQFGRLVTDEEIEITKELFEQMLDTLLR